MSYTNYRFETVTGPIEIRMQEGMPSHQTRSAHIAIDKLPPSAQVQIADDVVLVGKQHRLTTNGGNAHRLVVMDAGTDGADPTLELDLLVQTTAGDKPGISIVGEPKVMSPRRMDLVVNDDGDITVQGQPEGDNIHAVYEDGTTYIMPTSNPVHTVPEDKKHVPFRVMAGPFGKHTAMTSRHVLANGSICRMNSRGDVVENLGAPQGASV